MDDCCPGLSEVNLVCQILVAGEVVRSSNEVKLQWWIPEKTACLTSGYLCYYLPTLHEPEATLGLDSRVAGKALHYWLYLYL